MSLLDTGSEMANIREEACRKLSIDPKAMIPLGFHGDGVPHQKRKSIEVITWSFMAKGYDTRYLCAILDKSVCCACGCSGRHSLEPLLEVV